MVDRVRGTDTAFHQKNGSDALKQDCSILSLQRNTYYDPTQKRHDLRITHLPFHARTTTSAARALSEPHAADLGKAWHPPSRILDNVNRREQSAAHLPACLGQHG